MEESAFGRLASVLFAPAKTFAAIARRPTWGVALIVFLVVTAGVLCVVLPRVDVADMVRAQIEQSGRELTAEQVDGAIDLWEKILWPVTIGFAILGQSAFYLLAALFFWVGFKLLGGELSYRVSLSVTLHSFAPKLIAALLTIPVVLGKEAVDFAELQSGTLLASNLAAFAPEDTGPALRALMASVDVFSLWSLVLMIIGYRIAAKVSRGTAIGVVVGIWVFGVLVAAGFAGLGSR